MEREESGGEGIQLVEVETGTRAARTSTPKSGQSPDSRAGTGLADFQDEQDSLGVSPFGSSCGAPDQSSQSMGNSPLLPLPRLTPSSSSRSLFSPLYWSRRNRKGRMPDDGERLNLSANHPAAPPNPRTSSLAVEIPRPLSSFVSPIRVAPGKRLKATSNCIQNPTFDSMSSSSGVVFGSPGLVLEKVRTESKFHSPPFVSGREGRIFGMESKRNCHSLVQDENQARRNPSSDHVCGGASSSTGKAIFYISSTASGTECASHGAHLSSETAAGSDVKDSVFTPSKEWEARFSPRRPLTTRRVDDCAKLSDDERYYLCRPDADVNGDDYNDNDYDDEAIAVMKSTSFSDAIFDEAEGLDGNCFGIRFHAANLETACTERARDVAEGGERGEGDGEDQCEFCWQWFQEGSSLLHHYASSEATRCSCSQLDSLGSLSPRHQSHKRTKQGSGDAREEPTDGRTSDHADQGRFWNREEVTEAPRGTLQPYITFQDELGNIRLPFSRPLAQKIRELLSTATEDGSYAEPEPEDQGGGTSTAKRRAACGSERGETGPLGGEDTDDGLFDVFSPEDREGGLCSWTTSLQIHPQTRHRRRWRSEGGVASGKGAGPCHLGFSQSGAPEEEEAWYSFLDESSRFDGGEPNVSSSRKPNRYRKDKTESKRSTSRRRAKLSLGGSSNTVPSRKSVSIQAFEDSTEEQQEEWEEPHNNNRGAESLLDPANSRAESLDPVTTPNEKKWAERNNSSSHTSITSRSANPNARPLGSPDDQVRWAGLLEGVATNESEELLVGGARKLAMVTPLPPPHLIGQEDAPAVAVSEEEGAGLGEGAGLEEGAGPTLQDMGRIIRDLERNVPLRHGAGRSRSGSSRAVRRNCESVCPAGRESSSVRDNVTDDVTTPLITSLDATNACRSSVTGSRRSEGSESFLSCREDLQRGADNSLLWRSQVGEFAKGDNYCCIFCRREFVSPQEFIGHFSAGRSDSCSHSLSDFLHLLQVPSMARPDWWHCQCAIL